MSNAPLLACFLRFGNKSKSLLNESVGSIPSLKHRRIEILKPTQVSKSSVSLDLKGSKARRLESSKDQMIRDSKAQGPSISNAPKLEGWKAQRIKGSKDHRIKGSKD